jgi:gliding motility-associated-like protein
LRANFTVCNHYRKGIIPKGLMVSFYDADPATADAHLLAPVFVNGSDNSDTCVSFDHVFKGIPAGNVYAVVNDNGSTTPVHLPNHTDFLEKDYSNNSSTISYQPDTISVRPGDTAVLRDKSFPLSIAPGYDTASIIWYPGNGYTLSCFNCASPLITPKLNSVVKVQAATLYGCIDSGYARIKIFTGGRVNIPNAFTPNADGRNDVLYIMGGQELSLVKDFSIFNRWGGRVFEVRNASANDPSLGWNGKVNGKDALAGTYVYVATLAFTDGSVEVFKGTITLIR